MKYKQYSNTVVTFERNFLSSKWEKGPHGKEKFLNNTLKQLYNQN